MVHELQVHVKRRVAMVGYHMDAHPPVGTAKTHHHSSCWIRDVHAPNLSVCQATADCGGGLARRPVYVGIGAQFRMTGNHTGQHPPQACGAPPVRHSPADPGRSAPRRRPRSAAASAAERPADAAARAAAAAAAVRPGAGSAGPAAGLTALAAAVRTVRCRSCCRWTVARGRCG